MEQERIKINEIEYKGSCIYCIKNISNDKIYIGSTKNYRARANEHSCDLRKNRHVNRHLQRSFCLGNNFEINIIEKIETLLLIKKEEEYCSKYNTYDKAVGYNMNKPSEMPTFKMTKEHQIKLVAARKAKGYDTSHLRRPDVIKRQAEGKYKPVEAYNFDGKLIHSFDSTVSAAKFFNCFQQNINACLSGRRKSLYKLIWKYKIDTNTTRKN